VEVPLPPETTSLAPVAPLNLLPTEWEVLTHQTIPSDPAWVSLGMTPESYENFARNQAEITRWVTEARFQLERYKHGQQTKDK
jgi:hypothetical protein